ncbi:hypothetical protein [Ferrithrix thermotolerans]|nr:hypothetical protein [Ferrithrix thermotolerans]
MAQRISVLAVSRYCFDDIDNSPSRLSVSSEVGLNVLRDPRSGIVT